jgi:endonuclease/exonuclease/phosphatase family metal-dependent hydrolase
MKKVLKMILYLFIVIVLVFAGIIITAIITDYKPPEIVEVYKAKSPNTISDTFEFNIVNWNIGYCGLDASMDFFYDGGAHVRPPEQNVIENLKSVISFLNTQKSIDFFLLQEVDKKSKRSYKINQYDNIQNAFSKYHSFFGKNYDVFFVPTPPTEPYGKVVSGLMTLSKFNPVEVVRHQFPGNYGFPKGLFMLDRCFLVSRIPVSNGRNLLIINTHNSAYDDGSLKAGQMTYLKEFLLTEYDKGNYIVVGGDWNQCPPDVKTSFADFHFDTKNISRIDKDYLSSDWKWVFSNKIPTNRRVATPYDKNTSVTTVIDFFLISPNVENLAIENINLDFKNSDHQPVKARFRLKK